MKDEVPPVYNSQVILETVKVLKASTANQKIKARIEALLSCAAALFTGRKKGNFLGGADFLGYKSDNVKQKPLFRLELKLSGRLQILLCILSSHLLGLPKDNWRLRFPSIIPPQRLRDKIAELSDLLELYYAAFQSIKDIYTTVMTKEIDNEQCLLLTQATFEYARTKSDIIEVMVVCYCQGFAHFLKMPANYKSTLTQMFRTILGSRESSDSIERERRRFVEFCAFLGGVHVWRQESGSQRSFFMAYILSEMKCELNKKRQLATEILNPSVSAVKAEDTKQKFNRSQWFIRSIHCRIVLLWMKTNCFLASSKNIKKLLQLCIDEKTFDLEGRYSSWRKKLLAEAIVYSENKTFRLLDWKKENIRYDGPMPPDLPSCLLIPESDLTSGSKRGAGNLKLFRLQKRQRSSAIIEIEEQPRPLPPASDSSSADSGDVPGPGIRGTAKAPLQVDSDSSTDCGDANKTKVEEIPEVEVIASSKTKAKGATSKPKRAIGDTDKNAMPPLQVDSDSSTDCGGANVTKTARAPLHVDSDSSSDCSGANKTKDSTGSSTDCGEAPSVPVEISFPPKCTEETGYSKTEKVYGQNTIGAQFDTMISTLKTIKAWTRTAKGLPKELAAESVQKIDQLRMQLEGRTNSRWILSEPVPLPGHALVQTVQDDGKEVHVPKDELGVPIPHKGSYDCLKESTNPCDMWLVSDILDWWMQRQTAELKRDVGTQTMRFFSPFTMMKLFELSNFSLYKDNQDSVPLHLDYNRFRRLAKEKNEYPSEMFEYEKLFFPINLHDSHWISACVDILCRTITMYDSLKGGESMYAIAKLIEKFLELDYEVRGLESRLGKPFGSWTIMPNGVCGRQENSYDCGVFTCMIAENIRKGRDFSRRDQGHANMYREKMLQTATMYEKDAI